jgi:hypothetical protein
MVRLLGPPIARACAPRVSHDWIRVNETTEGFDISVDTTRMGTLHGSLGLKGPTGTAVITVDVELLPQAAQTSTRRPSRPADQAIMAAAIPADQSEGVTSAKERHKAPQAAGREAAEQGGQGAAEVTQPQAAMPQSTAPAAPSAAQPSIRMGAAYAGTVIALLAGIGGLISQALAHYSTQPEATFLFNLAVFAVPVVTAVIALTRIHRLVIIGFLQGMLWQAVPSLAANTVTVAHLSSAPGRALLGIASYALEVIAALLLMAAWSPAADGRRAPRIGVLPVMLLATVGLSQIAELVMYVTVGGELISYSSSLYLYILASAGVLVGLAVTWYAMSLRTRALGGALVLGWIIIAALMLVSIMAASPPGTLLFWSVLACVLLAAAVVTTVFYMRGSSDSEGALLSGGGAKL